MPITGLAEFSKRPDQFIGMHFFSPAERMPLVEIIRGKQTSDATLAKALDLAQALGKTPITVNDSPGFFTSRFIGSFVAESLKMADEGINPNLIENGARMVGMPMGALTIADSMGLDLAYGSSVSKAKEQGVEPAKTLISKLVTEHGRNGMKNGKGFFDYGADGSKKLWPGLQNLLPKLEQQPAIDEVKKRILYAQLSEGARAFAEGVLTSVIDGDLGATLGVGFPAYLGGPFSAMDNIGIASVVSECDRLAAAYGKQFAVPQLLRDMAKNGQTFFGQNAVKSPGARAA
jgi:3-hydroxyacyl-CoA dehydrogenase/enoyl-CoA hydratase/3-hydroxybutyryl-CoA epimerase